MSLGITTQPTITLEDEIQELADCIKFKLSTPSDPIVWPDDFDEAIRDSKLIPNFKQLVAGTAPGVSASSVKRWRFPIEGPQSTALSTYIMKANPNCSILNIPSCSDIAPRLCQGDTRITSINIGVKALTSCEFRDCPNLTKAFLPECSSVGYAAFFADTKLKTLSIPKCTSIGTAAFYNCESLTSVAVSSACSFIGSYAFSLCRRLSSITGITSKTSLGDGCFEGCGFTSLNPDFAVTEIPSKGFNDNMSLSYIHLSTACSFIYDEAFGFCSNLLKVDIPGVIMICSGGFSYCRKLQEFSAPNCAPSQDDTFLACSALSSLTLGYQKFSIYGTQISLRLPSVVEYLSLAKLSLIDEVEVFEYMGASLRHLYMGSLSTIPTGIQGLSSLSWCGCPLLTSIPATLFQNDTSMQYFSAPLLTNVPASCFQNCSNLTSLTIGTLSFVGSSAFQNCSQLTNIELNSESCTVNDYAFENCSQITPNLKGLYGSIGNYAFHNCRGVTELSASQINAVGKWGFEECVNLSYIDLPNCSYLSNAAFANCSNLLSITLPKVQFIGYNNFVGCPQLSSINMSDNTVLATISNQAFAGTAISIWSMKSTVTPIIGISAFRNCSQLQNFYGGATMIREYAFAGCASLSEITAEKCSAVGQYAFDSCSNLTAAYLYSLSIVSSYAFIGVSFAFNLMTEYFIPYTEMFSNIGPMGEESPYMGKVIITTTAAYNSYMNDTSWVNNFIGNGGVIRKGL